MNFLAHLYLSGDDPKIMVGNFIGDFVKGKNVGERFEQSIAFGIDLHRSIDEFTDRHHIVRSSKVRLREKYRHYSGVIVDMYYDHFLASNWNEFHPEPLDVYAQKAYAILKQHLPILPERVAWMLPYMIDGNWLVGYGTVHGIGRALSGMSRRTPFESKMDEATVELREHYPLFREEFMRFFPELKSFAEALVQSHRGNK
jgi:acyl carrier protein phosphodiesterase